MARAALRKKLRDAPGKHPALSLLADMIETQDESVMSGRVGWLVMSCRGIGRSGMVRFLRTAYLNEQTKVRDLSPARRQQIVELLREFH